MASRFVSGLQDGGRMTLLDDIQRLQKKCAALEQKVDTLESEQTRAMERIGGERGLSASVSALAQEIKELRAETKAENAKIRNAGYKIAGLIMAASIGFGFSVLQFMA
jgi:seryl-tRNA synthetase